MIMLAITIDIIVCRVLQLGVQGYLGFWGLGYDVDRLPGLMLPHARCQS